MDTRFWGPSGWKLLHTCTFLYPTKPSQDQKTNMSKFLETIPYILPCKFCRYSLACYYESDSPTSPSNIRSRGTLTRWLWRIHNQVNNKLRAQNLNPSPNPPFESVKDFYETWLKDGADYKCYLPAFWDFLFSVAYNHPKETKFHSTPMPECPEAVLTCKNDEERNKWNILPYKVRRTWFRRFWKCLPDVLGGSLGEKWREAEKATEPTLANRRATLAWLWRMRCYLDPDFKDPYTALCAKISNYSSNCHKSKRAMTCRRRQKRNPRHTSKNGASIN